METTPRTAGRYHHLGLLARMDGAGSKLGVLVPVEALMDAQGAPRES